MGDISNFESATSLVTSKYSGENSLNNISELYLESLADSKQLNFTMNLTVLSVSLGQFEYFSNILRTFKNLFIVKSSSGT